MTLFYPGAGHSEDNIVVWLEKHKVLFGGCLIKSLEAKGMGNLSDANVNQWRQSITNITDAFLLNTAVVVPGHGKPGDIELLRHTDKLVSEHLEKQ